MTRTVEQVAVAPRSRTAWGSVLGGWLATIGVAALLSPFITALLKNAYPSDRSIAAAVPVIVGVGLAYLIGGYIAGRMAGYRTSWHGLLVAFFGLFIVLSLIVLAVALQQGVFGATSYLPEILPALVTTGLYGSADALAFGGLLGMLIAIFAAWLGGLLAPTRTLAVPVASVVADRSEPLVVGGVEKTSSVELEHPQTPRRPFRLLPSAGRKGGERVVAAERVEPE